MSSRASDVQILITARNEANAALDQAIRKLVETQKAGASAGHSVAASFSEIAQEISRINPAVGSMLGQLQGMATIGKGGLGAVAIGAAAAGAALAGTLTAARSLSNEVERLDNVAAATGTSIQNIQVFGEVFKRAGLGAETAEAALIRLNRAIGEQNPLLAKLGVTSRDPYEALIQLSQAFSASSDQASKTKIAFELLGRGSGEVLKVIDHLAAIMPGLRSEMASTGELLSKDMVEAGRKFDKEWDTLAGRWEGTMNRIKHAAAVAANAVVDAFTPPSKDPFERVIQQREAMINRLSAQLKEARGQFGEADPGVLGMAKQLETLKRQLEIFRGSVKEFGQDDLSMSQGADGVAKSVDRVKGALDGMSEDAKKHAALLKEIAEAFHVTGTAAEALARQMEAGEVFRKRAELFKVLGTGPEEPPEVKKNREQVEETAAALDRLHAKLAEVSAVTGIPPGVIESLTGLGKEADATADQLNRATSEAEQIRVRFNQLKATLDEVSRETGISPDVLKSLAGVSDIAAGSSKEIGALISRLDTLGHEVERIKLVSPMPPEEIAKAVEARQKVDELTSALRTLGQLPPAQIKVLRTERREVNRAEFGAQLEQITDPNRIQDVKEKWILAFQDMTTAATLFDDTMRTGFNAVLDVFKAFSDALIAGGNVMKVKLGAIFRDMVSQVIVELERLAVAKIFQFFIRLLGGGLPTEALGQGLSLGTGGPALSPRSAIPAPQGSTFSAQRTAGTVLASANPNLETIVARTARVEGEAVAAAGDFPATIRSFRRMLDAVSLGDRSGGSFDALKRVSGDIREAIRSSDSIRTPAARIVERELRTIFAGADSRIEVHPAKVEAPVVNVPEFSPRIGRALDRLVQLAEEDNRRADRPQRTPVPDPRTLETYIASLARRSQQNEAANRGF